MLPQRLLVVSLLAGSVAGPALADVLKLRVADPQPMFDAAAGKWNVFVRLSAESARAFGRFTQSHVQQRINVLIDGKVMVTPFIVTPMETGAFTVGDMNTFEEAKALADRLRSGRSILTVAPIE